MPDLIPSNAVLLYIHRNYFARALLDYPTNPLRSPYAPSFLASYRSATALLKSLKKNFALFPNIYLRHWPTWAHALAASVSTCIVLGVRESFADSRLIGNCGICCDEEP